MNPLSYRIPRPSLRVLLTALLPCMALLASACESGGQAPTGAGDGGAAPGARTGTATVSSNLLGGSYAASDAVVTIDKHASTSVPGTFVEELEIYVVDRPEFCADLQANRRPAGGTRLKIEIEKRGATAEAATVTAGTYELVTDASAAPSVTSKLEGSTYFANDAGACSRTDLASLDKIARADLAKNELVLATVGVDGVTGSFDLTFRDGRFVRGTFDAPACDDSGKPAGVTTCR